MLLFAIVRPNHPADVSLGTMIVSVFDKLHRLRPCLRRYRAAVLQDSGARVEVSDVPGALWNAILSFAGVTELVFVGVVSSRMRSWVNVRLACVLRDTWPEGASLVHPPSALELFAPIEFGTRILQTLGNPERVEFILQSLCENGDMLILAGGYPGDRGRVVLAALFEACRSYRDKKGVCRPAINGLRMILKTDDRLKAFACDLGFVPLLLDFAGRDNDTGLLALGALADLCTFPEADVLTVAFPEISLMQGALRKRIGRAFFEAKNVPMLTALCATLGDDQRFIVAQVFHQLALCSFDAQDTLPSAIMHAFIHGGALMPLLRLMRTDRPNDARQQDVMLLMLVAIQSEEQRSARDSSSDDCPPKVGDRVVVKDSMWDPWTAGVVETTSWNGCQVACHGRDEPVRSWENVHVVPCNDALKQLFFRIELSGAIPVLVSNLSSTNPVIRNLSAELLSYFAGPYVSLSTRRRVIAANGIQSLVQSADFCDKESVAALHEFCAHSDEARSIAYDSDAVAKLCFKLEAIDASWEVLSANEKARLYFLDLESEIVALLGHLWYCNHQQRLRGVAAGVVPTLIRLFKRHRGNEDAEEAIAHALISLVADVKTAIPALDADADSIVNVLKTSGAISELQDILDTQPPEAHIQEWLPGYLEALQSRSD
eukprot:TRINITY_DN6467_c1_g1_i1.p1 TRINITY_DN6467_c1_g1~~TRINITY_DN6467_c1_g1_i1.p1  ORF type:complete len:659 (+),score=77.96 TRINITY_DN6467_c1_g1_i1:78-2054(+)